MTYSFERAGLLLHVVEKAHGHPKLTGIHDAAMDELEQMSHEAADGVALARAERQKKAQAEAAKKQQAEDARFRKIEEEKVAEAKRNAQQQAEAEKPKPFVQPESVRPQPEPEPPLFREPEPTIERRELTDV